MPHYSSNSDTDAYFLLQNELFTSTSNIFGMKKNKEATQNKNKSRISNSEVMDIPNSGSIDVDDREHLNTQQNLETQENDDWESVDFNFHVACAIGKQSR